MLENDKNVDIVIFADETLEVEIMEVEPVSIEDTTDYLLIYNLAKI